MQKHLKSVLAGTIALTMGASSFAMAAAPAATPPAAPATPAQNKPANPAAAGAEEIRTAVTALQKEYADFEADPTKTLTVESAYFKKNQAPDITQQLIMNALNQSYGRDASADAYVKLQLLSGVAGKWDDNLVRQGVTVYQRAISAPLIPHPGQNHQLDAIASKMSAKTPEDQVTKINDELTAAIKTNTTQNAPILAYRNQLFSLLPYSTESFGLAMQDAANRMNHGLDASSLVSTLKGAITEWSSDAKAPDLKAMAGNLRALVSLAGNTKLAPDVKLAGEKGVYKWTKGTLMDTKSATTLAETLDKDVAHPPEQLGFKKDE